MKFYLCLKCGAEEFDELLTSAPPRHPKCMGTVIGFDDAMERSHVAHALLQARECEVWNVAYAAAYVAEAVSWHVELGDAAVSHRESIRPVAKRVADVALECWRKDRPA